MLRIDDQRAPSREVECGTMAAFLRASEEIRFVGVNRQHVYAWIETVLREQRYGQQGRRHRFAQRYTQTDIELLAAVDEAHETLSGPATRRILEREYRFGKNSPDFWNIPNWS